MKIVGIDFAAQNDATCAAFGEANAQGRVLVTKLQGHVSDQAIASIISRQDAAVVALDVPFGWPDKFVTFVAEHHMGRKPPPVSSEEFRYRYTDLVVHRETGKWPLSVSTDKIGIVARRAASLLAILEDCDIPPIRLTGRATRVIEVYPAGTLAAMKLWERGYGSKAKGKQRQAGEARTRIIAGLVARGLDLSESDAEQCRENPDALDACICVFTGALFLRDATHPLPDDPVVKREGWIFFPKNEGLVP